MERLLQWVTIIIYCSLSISAIVCAVLYHHAFVEMKRSKIIMSVLVLMLAIAIDSVWWFMAEFFRFMTGDYVPVTLHPVSLIIVKGIMLVAMLLFIKCSVVKDQSIKVKKLQSRKLKHTRIKVML